MQEPRAPWYERLIDRDNSTAPVVLLVLLVVIVVVILTFGGPLLDRLVTGRGEETRRLSRRAAPAAALPNSHDRVAARCGAAPLPRRCYRQGQTT